MHIPDGFLSASVATATWVGSSACVAASLRRERPGRDEVPSSMLGALAAFVFSAQLVNVPVLPGTSGHLVGGMLAAALVGPDRGLVVLAVVLAVQALVFQDGGVTAFGTNLLSMGVAGCYGGYGIAALVARAFSGTGGLVGGAVLGAFVATLLGAAVVGLALAASGLYPLPVVLPLLLAVHLPIGLLEAALTGAVLATVLRWRPDVARGLQRAGRATRAAPALGLVALALAVAAFAAPFASELPDGLESVAERLGFASAARAVWPSPLPDYDVRWLHLGRAGVAVAGVIGTLAAALLAWVIGGRFRGLAGGEQPHR
jgi:cobalt/nickel transport system permease protein